MKTILDKGYVRLVDSMGSDLTIVNAARASFAKESHELNEKDERLIKFLADNNHTSPFRHAVLQFEIKAPLMVARQWWKYIIGSSHLEGSQEALNAWNESSRRYVTEDPTFYIPNENEWRGKPANNKQGSTDPVSNEIGFKFTKELEEYIDKGVALYENAMESGICAEEARLFLPAYGMYVNWYWTASLQAVAHFTKQRMDNHSQYEIRQYAKAVKDLALEKFPLGMAAFLTEEEINE
ncbi:MAG: FAD-dependent thymidylate synthase [Ezakiella sp.]|nr:FAD-dependent thymidylate synthase [Ezakiella sp.]MDD7471797.1 FAD-dependent thymidylate synthase [Bacillota bacterium]MDY3923762.1 FAD-dependent thymidylate synthase [Ezakiella sp.]